MYLSLKKVTRTLRFTYAYSPNSPLSSADFTSFTFGIGIHSFQSNFLTALSRTDERGCYPTDDGFFFNLHRLKYDSKMCSLKDEFTPFIN